VPKHRQTQFAWRSPVKGYDCLYMIRIFRVSIPASVLGLLTSESALIFACYIFAYYWELGVDVDTHLNAEHGIARISAVAAAFVMGAYLTDLYTEIRVRSTIILISRVMGILGTAVICQAIIGYSNADWALPKSVVITGSMVALVVLSAWRILYSGALITALGLNRVLFLGSSPLVFKIAAQLQEHPELGMKSIGYLSAVPAETNLIKWLGEPEDVTSVVNRMHPDTVVIAGATDTRLPMHDLLDVRFAGIPIEEAPAVYEQAFGRVCVDDILPYQLIISTELGPRRWTVRVQTIYSILIAVMGLLVAAPLILVAAVLIKVTSNGPVFYRQTRAGWRGEPFTVYKLRSMYQDAEAKTGAVWATQNDPRITPLGRFLRKSRLDELPQLWNVLKGDMSIVGPRPERPEFVRELSEVIPYYRQRHCVKPGITGWAQINYRYGETIQDTKVKIEYDLYYIKNLSPSLDAYIIFQTAKIMLLSRGAQ
jgi:exopolysaccharide biosynthesis polyprenyl glycosylphosphotransferase